MVSIQLQCDSDSGVCCESDWQMAQLGAGSQRMQEKSEAGAVAGTVQALLDLGVAGDFLPKFAVPGGGQLWASPAAVPREVGKGT